MEPKESPKIEQISLDRLFENALEKFEHGMLAVDARVILWGSLGDDQALVKQFLVRKGQEHLLDRRRRLTRPEQDRLEAVELAAARVLEYVEWMRSAGGQPLLQEALVTYCVEFEGCLKGIAIAFLLAQRAGKQGLAAQIFVPGQAVSTARREFRLPNAIVHSLSRLGTKVELGPHVFHPGWEIELTSRDLQNVDRAFHSIVHPFTMMARL